MTLAIGEDWNHWHPSGTSGDRLKLGVRAVLRFETAGTRCDNDSRRVDQDQAGTAEARLGNVSFAAIGHERAIDNEKELVFRTMMKIENLSIDQTIGTGIPLRLR